MVSYARHMKQSRFWKLGSEFILLRPGIRMADDQIDDQKRVATPIMQGCRSKFNSCRTVNYNGQLTQ